MKILCFAHTNNPVRRLVLIGAALGLLALLLFVRGGTPSADLAKVGGGTPSADLAKVRGGTHSADSAKVRGGTHSAEVSAEVWQTVKGGWGSRPGEFGRLRPQEANAEAPMSLVAGAAKLCVLDQVNDRLQCFPGATSTRLPVHGAQDVKLTKDGRAVVLDRLSDKEVVVMGEPPLRFPVSAGGTSTGLFIDGRDIYVEHDHEVLTRVGSLDGPVPLATLPGRPTRDGVALLKAAIVDAAQGRFYVSSIARGTLAQRFSRELSVPPPLQQLDLLDSDAHGTIYVAANDGAVVTLICLNGATGETLGSVSLPASDQPDETFQNFTVLDEGGVIYARAAVDGYSTAPYDCR